MTHSTLCADFEHAQDRPTLLTVAVAWVKKANCVYRQRLALKSMSPSQLDDIGLSYDAAQREASRPFWDLP